MLFYDIKLILKQSGKFIDLGLLLRPDEEWKKCHKIETKNIQSFSTLTQNQKIQFPLEISLHIIASSIQYFISTFEALTSDLSSRIRSWSCVHPLWAILTSSSREDHQPLTADI